MSDERDLSSIYVWFDTEFTSLTLERAALLQISMVLTNAQLERILPPAEDFNCLVALPPDTTCDPWVSEHLPGLIARCRTAEARPLAEVNQLLGDYLDRVLTPIPAAPAKRPVLAGNSIHSDWFLARRDLPALIQRLNYRVLDASSWKVFWKHSLRGKPFEKDDAAVLQRWFPGSFTSLATEHDAHYDVLASIAEMNYYRCQVESAMQGAMAPA